MPIIASMDLVTLATSDPSLADISIAIGTLVASSFVSWVTARRTMRSDHRRAIREDITRLLAWAIEYPFLEDEAFSRSWPNTSRSHDDNLRYDNYCCHVFNLILHAWELHGSDELKMRPTLYPEELVACHRNWWRTQEANQQGYPTEFRQFVATIIRRLEDKEKTNA